MTDERITGAADESVPPSNIDTEQSHESDQREEAEEAVAAKLGDVA